MIFNKLKYFACCLALSPFSVQNHALAEDLNPTLGVSEVSLLDDLPVKQAEANIAAGGSDEKAEINPDTLGILNETNGGVSKDYWVNRSYEDVAEVLTQLDISTISRAYNTFLERLILSTTNVPVPETPSQWGKILDIRIKKLINAGRFASAVKLINTLPTQYGADLYGKEIVKMGLVNFDNASVCGAVEKQSEQNFSLNFWRITDLVCSVVAGEKADVDAKLLELKSQKISLPEGLKPLILMAVHGTEIPQYVRVSINPWSLNLLRLLGYGIGVPADLDSVYIKRGLLLNTNVDAYDRILLAEEMFAASAIDTNTLYSIYSSVTDSPELGGERTGEDKKKIAKNENSAKSKVLMPLGFQRIKAYKAVEKSPLLGDKLRAVEQVYDNATSYRDKIETLYIFAPMFEKIKPVSGDQGEKVARMFYAIGDFKQGLKWALKNKEALWYEMALAQRVSTPKNVIKFIQGEGFSSDVDDSNTISPEEEKGLFDSIFSNEEVETDYASKSGVYVNASPLAQDIDERNAWVQFIKKKYGKDKRDIGARRMTQAFLSLEALGYTISDAEWIQASSMSGYVQEMAFSPAKIRALNILSNKTYDPIETLLAVRPFIEATDVGDEDFSKIMKVLYRAGYGEIAQRMALERLAYHDW